MSWFRRRPSPALVIACLSLAIALGGTGYAAVVLPANSVGTKQLINGSVVAAKVKAHSLVAANFKTGELPAGPRGADGLPAPRVPPASREIPPRSCSQPSRRRPVARASSSDRRTASERW